jgi:hypothetical protein
VTPIVWPRWQEGSAVHSPGAGVIPEDWIAQVDEAARKDTYTSNHRPVEETADGLVEALLAPARRLEAYQQFMDC